MEKLLLAMAASEKRGDSQADDAGAKLLAFIQAGKDQPLVEGLGQKQNLLAKLLAEDGTIGESKISYDRAFLFSCSDSPICQEMPKALGDKLNEFPQVS